MIGAVGRPGPVESSGRLTLLEVLTAAGGVAPSTATSSTSSATATTASSDQLTVRLDDLLLRGDARMNMPIFPGDLINVPADVEVTVFCLGEVSTRGR